MATIEDLAITLSRSSDGTVGVKVSYTATFSSTECSLESLEFSDAVWLYERKGVRDDERGFDPKDPDDVKVAWLDVGDSFKPFGAKDGKVVRSIERNLTSEELVKLRDVGREHPYVAVNLRPVSVSEDYRSVELDQIDIGDPGE